MRITKRTVDALTAGPADVFAWDDKLAGFAVRVKPSGAKTYLIQYRNKDGRSRRFTLGRHGVLTPDQAREAARLALASVLKGEDPAAAKKTALHAPTVAALCERYLAEHVKPHNKPRTADEFTRLVEKRIKPELGKFKVAGLTRQDVRTWHLAMAATPYEANRSLAVLRKMFSLAVKDWELRDDNPASGIKLHAERKRERFFAEVELKRLGEALAATARDGTELPAALAAVKLLAFTGCRVSEILGLAWSDVDLESGALRLRDAKAGARSVALGAPAMALLAELPRLGPWVVPSPNPAEPLTISSLEKTWGRVRAKAKLDNARLHDLRHTKGTYAAQAGLNAFMIRDMLGHKTLAMTGRYVERDTDPLRAADDVVAGRIAAALEGKTATVVPFAHRKAG